MVSTRESPGHPSCLLCFMHLCGRESRVQEAELRKRSVPPLDVSLAEVVFGSRLPALITSFRDDWKAQETTSKCIVQSRGPILMRWRGLRPSPGGLAASPPAPRAHTITARNHYPLPSPPTSALISRRRCHCAANSSSPALHASPYLVLSTLRL